MTIYSDVCRASLNLAGLLFIIRSRSRIWAYTGITFQRNQHDGINGNIKCDQQNRFHRYSAMYELHFNIISCKSQLIPINSKLFRSNEINSQFKRAHLCRYFIFQSVQIIYKPVFLCSVFCSFLSNHLYKAELLLACFLLCERARHARGQ